MTNPTPRPALRKADDADVHPAAPKPARARRSPVPAAAPGPVAADAATAAAETLATPDQPEKPARAGTGARRAFQGATSDGLLPAPDTAAAATAAPVSVVGADLMKGKLVELEAKVPKNLRKAARAEARRAGLDLDAVTTDLLHAWVVSRRP